MSLIMDRGEIQRMLRSRTCDECKLVVTMALCRDDDDFTEVGHGPRCSCSHDEHLKHNLQRIGDDPNELLMTPRARHQGNYDPMREQALQAHRGEPKFPRNPNCNLCQGKGIREYEEEDADYCMCRYQEELPDWALRKVATS